MVKKLLVVKNPSANVGDVRNTDLIPGLGRPPERGHGKRAFQYSCLENPMDKGAWQATVPWGHKESDITEAT